MSEFFLPVEQLLSKFFFSIVSNWVGKLLQSQQPELGMGIHCGWVYDREFKEGKQGNLIDVKEMELCKRWIEGRRNGCEKKRVEKSLFWGFKTTRALHVIVKLENLSQLSYSDEWWFHTKKKNPKRWLLTQKFLKDGLWQKKMFLKGGF